MGYIHKANLQRIHYSILLNKIHKKVNNKHKIYEFLIDINKDVDMVNH